MSAKRKPLYPGEGTPWADFLHHRMRVLAQLRDEGKTPEQTARTLSMDQGQVVLILGHWDDYYAPRPRKAKGGRHGKA